MDPAFQNYGQVITGYDCKPLSETLEAATPLPEAVEYVPLQKELMELPVARELAAGVYGGMPIQLGWCNGHNTKLNCLEYHRDSELNLGSRDFILLVAQAGGYPEDGRLDTATGSGLPLPSRASWWRSTPPRCTTPPALPTRGAGLPGSSSCCPLGTNGPRPEISGAEK